MGDLRVLAFDPSESTGVAIGTIKDKTLHIEKVGMLFAKKELDLGLMYLDYDMKVQRLIMIEEPQIVIQESFFASGKFCQGVDVNFVLRGLISMACSREDKSLLTASPSEWKKFVAKRSSPTKEEKLKYGTKAKKAFIQEALRNKGIILPEKYTGPSGRKINVTSDVWDAIGILLYGAYLIDHTDAVENITLQDLTLF